MLVTIPDVGGEDVPLVLVAAQHELPGLHGHLLRVHTLVPHLLVCIDRPIRKLIRKEATPLLIDH